MSLTPQHKKTKKLTDTDRIVTCQQRSMGRAHGHSLDLQGVDGGGCDGGEHVDLFDQPLQHAVAVDLIQTQLVVPAASPSANTSTDADHKGLIGTLISLKDSRAQELCESRGGRPGLPVPNSHYGLYGRKAKLNIVCLSELRGCVKVKVTIPGSPSLLVFMVSMDIKQHWTFCVSQSSGAAWKSRWPFWAHCPWWSIWSLWM